MNYESLWYTLKKEIKDSGKTSYGMNQLLEVMDEIEIDHARIDGSRWKPVREPEDIS